jgi:hypothetical protein
MVSSQGRTQSQSSKVSKFQGLVCGRSELNPESFNPLLFSVALLSSNRTLKP